ncbi:YhgE/Pip domain-containing protein [Bacillus sp. B15-48]|uniref:YhgE/Pip domain-containing protein n=1 Tax=Bacillus sp. B15-48 TaxID=1548601 RepID=UPI001EF28BBD|nr:YhgE/Pip domain-containing protein [Bacillus sp. B15-48]
MGKRRIFLVLMALILVLPSFLVSAAANENEKAGEFIAKDEVVYATLSATGGQQEIYVVNIFDVVKPGKITDYGTYETVKNLTNLATIEQQGNRVDLSAEKGKFYYQGNMRDEPLPWNFTIDYLLDGKKRAPEELVGQDGQVKINIHTSANEHVDLVFYDHYLLQITLTIDPGLFSNIEAGDGMVVNAGKNKQITFTVMPEQDGELSFEADVVDFELAAIEIAAVPSSMSIDAPDTDEMTGEMESLTDAIRQLNDGVGELKNGASQLSDGAIRLRDGSEQYHNGMSNLKGASPELVKGSEAINDALTKISNSLQVDAIDLDLSDFADLTDSLMNGGDGLLDLADRISSIREQYATAYERLDKALKAVPETGISEADIQKIYDSGADAAILDQLLETYTAALTAKEAFPDVKKSFESIDPLLGEMSGTARGIGDRLLQSAEGITSALEELDQFDGLTQLQEGMATLTTNYRAFHGGLVDYTKGAGQLSDSYSELHSGLVKFTNGTGELAKGVGELHAGTTELYNATSRLPDQIQEEINRMIAEYDKSDFDVISFVSPENEKLHSVQFVIKTASLKKDVKETNEQPVKEQKGFWAKFFDLFR